MVEQHEGGEGTDPVARIAGVHIRHGSTAVLYPAFVSWWGLKWEMLAFTETNLCFVYESCFKKNKTFIGSWSYIRHTMLLMSWGPIWYMYYHCLKTIHIIKHTIKTTMIVFIVKCDIDLICDLKNNTSIGCSYQMSLYQ